MDTTTEGRTTMTPHPDGCDGCGRILPLFHNDATGASLCEDCDSATDDGALRAMFDTPANVKDADDVNAAIRAGWYDVCRDFPNATTPLVAKRVADEFGISVARVFESFPAPRDDA